jgi:hypothetical protein
MFNPLLYNFSAISIDSAEVMWIFLVESLVNSMVDKGRGLHFDFWFPYTFTILLFFN